MTAGRFRPGHGGRRANVHARRKGSSVVGGHGAGEHDKIGYPRVGHPVEGVAALPPRLHVAASSQARQMRRDPALGQADMGHAFSHRVLAGKQELQQSQPRRIPQGAEEPGHHLNPVISRGQQRRVGQDNTASPVGARRVSTRHGRA